MCGGFHAKFQVSRTNRKKSTQLFHPKSRLTVFATVCETEAEDPRQLVSHRHGAVLGLCSVVTAFPHTVPASVPPLLVYLGQFLHDRQPIPGTEVAPLLASLQHCYPLQPPSRRRSRAGRELTRTTGLNTNWPSLRINWQR